MAMNNIPGILQQQQSTLQQLNSETQHIPYRHAHWATHFADDPDFVYITTTYPDTLSRGNIAAIARYIHQHRERTWIRRLFLATMMWGYGTVGYGPYRTARMLTPSHATDVLSHAFTAIASGNLIDAYQQFRLPMCGSAFFTKYFYFIGLGAHITPQPLVLDSVVINRLETLLQLDVTQYARVTRNTQGVISAVGYDATGYLKYVQLLNMWAHVLECRADSIELFLFRGS